MNILIADDIAINRKLLCAMLEAEGHLTVEASDGIEALQILSRERVDAVVSDILMPRMDGYRLCYEIRTTERLRDLPVVIYTSTYTSANDEKLALDVGADKYLKKPSPVGTILTALHEAIVREHGAPHPPSPKEVEVLKEYSDRLVAKLEEKNIELEERVRLAGLSMDVTTALMHGDTLRQVLQSSCEAVVRHLDAAFARIWTLNELENVLELQASAGMYTHINGPHRRVPVGQFKIGLIAAERKPHVTNSIVGDPRVAEQEWARREGLVAFAGHPLIVGGRLVGVLAMFARNALSQPALDKLASVANEIAIGIGRKFVEAELLSTHDRLRQLLDLSPAILYDLRIEGQTVIPTFVSANIDRLLGIPPEEANSEEWWLKSLHPDDHDRMLATRTSGIKEGGYTAEYRLRHRDGSYRWIVDSNRVRRDDAGEPREIAGVWTDITEHKRERDLQRALKLRNERLEEAVAQRTRELADANERLTMLDRSKSAFLNLISHELRTPLNGLFGVGELILDQMPPTEENRELQRLFEHSRRRLLSIVDDSLLLTEIDVNGEQFRSGPVSLSRVLSRAMEGAIEFAEPRYVRLGPPPPGLGLVVGNEDLLARAFQALLETAVKFSEKDATVRLSSDTTHDAFAVVIESHGRTIPGPALREFFELFSLDAAITPGGDLGLAVPAARRILTLFGASVSVANQESSGIRLTVSLKDVPHQLVGRTASPANSEYPL